MRRIFAIAAIAGLGACGGGKPAHGDAVPAGQCSAAPGSRTGQGTYYAADGTGACSFDASPNDLMVAAMNAADWAHSAWCGACLDVTGPSGHVVIRVVDECPGCATGDLDLSMQAFAAISPLAAGRVAITWQEVECPVTTPIAYHFKDGSNPYWSAIQLRTTRYPIATLEAKDGSGAWQPLARQDYNYFVYASGLGNGPYALRVTDARGQQLEDDTIPFSGAATTQNGAAQFPSCP